MAIILNEQLFSRSFYLLDSDLRFPTYSPGHLTLMFHVRETKPFDFLLSFYHLTAHWPYMALARMTRLSTSVLLRTALALRRQVPASLCSGPMAYLVCPPMCRPRPSPPPPSGCLGRSPIRTHRTSSVMCSTSAGPQVSLQWIFK